MWPRSLIHFRFRRWSWLLMRLTELFIRSMSTGHFPSTFKEAFITPSIKKPGLDATNTQSYRPISNLSVVSKLLERIVAQQLNTYLESSGLLPSLQSRFRPGHSTETAVLQVLSDLLQAVDSGDVAALVLLDLSAAFDTVDHAILCRRLRLSFGLDCSALAWFQIPVCSAWCPQIVVCSAHLWTRLSPGYYSVYYVYNFKKILSLCQMC